MSDIPPIHEVPTPNMNVTCPHCQAHLSAAPSQAGSVIDCPKCAGKFQVPMPTAGGASVGAYGGGGYGGGYSGSPEVAAFASKKIAAGICGILLGAFGVHKFVLGLNNAGIIMLVVSIVGVCGSLLVVPILATTAMGIIGLVEGILYLTKSDEEFYQLYAVQKKAWF